jgi:hypothetical protein
MKTKQRDEQPVLFESPKRDGKRKAAVAKVAAEVKRQPPKSTAVAKIEQHPASTGENLLVIIARAAADPQCQPEKMRALLEMQKEIRAEEARIAATQDFIAMSSVMPSVNKDGRIVIDPKPGSRSMKQQVTLYAKYENMHKVVTPILRQHGFAYWTEPAEGNGTVPIVMRCHLDHISGHNRTCAIPLPFETSGSKNNVQGIGASLTYGKRYGLMSLCNIVSHDPKDADSDGNEDVEEEKPKTINGSQAKELLIAINDSEVEPTTFMEKYKINAVHELPAAMFAEALKSLADHKRRKAEARAAREASRG